MMDFICNMVYFVTVLLFGTAVSFAFAGIPVRKRSILSLLLFCSLEGALQIGISFLSGMHFAKQVYPVITHLPLVLFLFLVYKCTLLHAVVSVLSAYLCCQIPWWFAYFFSLFLSGKILHTIVYVLAALLTYWLLYRYAAGPMEHFMKHSVKSALMAGSIPFAYYCFDYATTVYTDWLYSGNITAVQFMPSVLACFYFLFIIVYYKEICLKEEAKYQAEALSLQLQYAAGALDNMRQLEEHTIAYRHDMRHHLGYIQALLTSGHPEKIPEYICAIQLKIDAVTPKKFCRNEVVNLVLSTYDLRAKKKGVTFDILADVPDTVSVSDTDLCAVLSNALENALNAAARTSEKIIYVKLTVRNQSLLLQISNPYSGEITFRDRLPAASGENHGIGTKSIAAIVDSYNGQYVFSAKDHLFTLRIMLPLT